jgi:hypothetical protein
MKKKLILRLRVRQSFPSGNELPDDFSGYIDGGAALFGFGFALVQLSFPSDVLNQERIAQVGSSR